MEKKVVIGYKVLRNDDGSVDVEDANLEGTTRVNAEEIFKDIEDVSELIKRKRIENAAYVGAYNGVNRFYQEVSAAQAQAAAEPNNNVEE